MAFFDEVGKKISQAGQSAVQKTKEMTELARINGAIGEEEKKINNTYYQIGKLYVALHNSDYEADFEGMITVIKESEQRILQYREQIQQIKKVVRCENCGAEIADNAAFCSSCGAQMQKKTAPVDENTIRCPGCGQMVSKGMRFCTSCGRSLVELTQQITAPETVAVENVNAQDVVEEPVSKKCPQCGVEIVEDSAFCTECGTRL